MISVTMGIDNGLYCGDAVFGEDTFKKYPILFYTFIDETLKSFKKLKQIIPFVDVVVIYHGGVIDDLVSLIDEHEQRILETKNTILKMLQQEPSSVDEITAKIMQMYQIPDDIVSYALTKTPTQAYIAELERDNIIEITVLNGIARAHLINKGLHNTHPSTQVVL